MQSTPAPSPLLTKPLERGLSVLESLGEALGLNAYLAALEVDFDDADVEADLRYGR